MKTWMLAIVLVVGLITFAARGQSVTVSYTNGTVAPCDGSTHSDTYSPGSDITLNLSACATRVNIYASSTSVNIGRVTLTGGPTTGFIDVVVGVGTLVISDTSPIPSCNDWAGLDVGGLSTNLTVRLGGGIAGNLTNYINVDQISRLDVGGTIQAQVQAVTRINGTGILVIQARDIASCGAGCAQVLVTSGNITRVRTTGSSGINAIIQASQGSIGEISCLGGGSLNASISAANGLITNIDVDGNIGTSSAPVAITAKTGVGSIEAASIYSTIVTNQGNSSSMNGGLTRLQTTSGPFVGSLTTRFLYGSSSSDGIVVAGTLDANVSIVDDVHRQIAAASLASGRTLSLQHIGADGSINFGNGAINGNITLTGYASGNITVGALNGTLSMISAAAYPLPGSVSITLASISSTGKLKFSDSLESTASVNVTGSMAGQIVMNNGNLSTAGTWNGNVVVGTGGGAITLGPGQSQPNQAPYYQRVLSGLGGGAVGLAPFHLYENDCSPPNNSYFTYSQFEPSGSDQRGAIVRYYGPVELLDVDLVPKVEWQMRDENGNNQWHDVSPRFTVTVNPAGVTNSARSVRICYSGTSGTLPTGRYRMNIQEGRLVCAGVTGVPDAVGDYYFNIGLDCGSQNCDGTINASDFIADLDWSATIDCNGNNILDECDLHCDAARIDKNNNGVIDTCGDIGSCPCNYHADTYLNSQDFFDFLTCFFGGTCPTGRTSDYNGDTFVNSQDFFDFLVCFFSNCDM